MPRSAHLAAEMRHALRTLIRRPAFTAGVVLTLSLGVGATTGLFSVVYGVLFRPLPFSQPEELAVVWEANPSRDIPFMKVSLRGVEDWRAASDALDDIGAWTTTSATTMTPAGGERLRIARVTPGLFDVLRVRPMLGRPFLADEGAPGAARVALLADATWRRVFAADPAVVGQSFDVDGEPVEIVGVLPASFTFPMPIDQDIEVRIVPADVFVPIAAGPSASRTAHGFYAIGRLRPGVPFDTAQEELAGIARRIEAENPSTNTGWTVRLVPLTEAVTGDARPALLALLAAVAVVLLLACTNVAYLLLARALDRRRDVAVRTALGAGRLQLARQFVMEGLVLAALGAAGGLVLAGWVVRLLVRLAPADIPRLDEVGVDGVTLVVAVAASLVASLVASLAPIVHAWRTGTVLALRDRGAGTTPGVRAAQRLVIAAEAAMAVVLVVLAALFGRALLELRGIDPGFTPDNVLVSHATLSGPAFGTAEARTAFLEQALERLEALPGVARAATVDIAPFDGDRQGTSFAIEGAPPFGPDVRPVMNVSWVSPGYFEVMGNRLLEGRTFTPADRRGGEPVTIVNESLAREFFPGTSPVGRKMRLGFDMETPRTVVGVVADERHESLQGDLRAATYTPVYQVSVARTAFVIRTEGDPAALVGSVQAVMRRLDRRLAVYDITPMARVVSATYGTSQFAVQLTSAFAGLAIVLAIAGVFGVTSHGVSARVAEIGVRIALGAGPIDVRRAVVRPTMALVAVGTLIGLIVALSVARLAGDLLYGVSALDPTSYLTAVVVVMGAAGLATWLPARRASRIDPLLALRSD